MAPVARAAGALPRCTGGSASKTATRRAAAAPLLAGLAAVVALGGLRARPAPSGAWLARPAAAGPLATQRRLRAGRQPATLLCAVQPLSTERTKAYLECVEFFDPEDPKYQEDFDEGPPLTGFRNISECIRPYHPNPEWMLWPDPVGDFPRDQKICSMYTLATGLFKEINAAIRNDNEDSMRRHARFIWELRQVLKFERSKICQPDGRRVKPFTGKVLRGLTVPVEACEELANLYQVGTEFTWPAFTSCQLEEGGLWPFDGNLNFEIECNIDPAKLKADTVFAPVSIRRFLGGSNEVLFPPHTRFKVTGERPVEAVTENEETRDVYTKILEVVELPEPMSPP